MGLSFENFLAKSSVDEILTTARSAAGLIRKPWNPSWGHVLTALHNNPGITPKTISDGTPKDMMRRWLEKYEKGYANRISVRVSSLPGTIADPAVEAIIKVRLNHLKEEGLQRIIFGHRLAMSAENILGLMLEEYLSTRLASHGWHSCWGDTARSIDFIHKNGALLQVKNRSNSENSSSNKVRAGTEIKKWHRVDAATGTYQWDGLIRQTGCPKLSENDFRRFLRQVIISNPKAFAIEVNNPWKNP